MLTCVSLSFQRLHENAASRRIGLFVTIYFPTALYPQQRATGRACPPNPMNRGELYMSARPKFAAFNQGIIPTIACFNKATIPLGVDFDALIAGMQAYVDQY